MSVIDIREYGRGTALRKIGQKPSLHAVPQNQYDANVAPKFGANLQSDRNTCHIVRPDKPISSTLRSLYAVPTAASAARASEADVHWRIESARIDTHVSVAHEASEGDIRQQIARGLVYARRLVQALSLRKVVSFIALMAMSIFAGLAAVTIFGLSPDVGQTRVVQPGDTVVSIAESIDAPVAESQIVSDIYALNVIEGGVVQPGQRLVIPRY